MNSAQQLYIRFFLTASLLVKILTFCTKLLQLPKSITKEAHQHQLQISVLQKNIIQPRSPF